MKQINIEHYQQTAFGRLLLKYNINLNDIKDENKRVTYYNWLSEKTRDPRMSTLREFINQVRNQCLIPIEELVACFDSVDIENQNHILTITSNMMTRPALSVIQYLMDTKYNQKRVLVINATPYGDLCNYFGVASHDTLKIMQIDIDRIPMKEELEANIYCSSNDKIDFLNLSFEYMGGNICADEEKSIIRSLKNRLLDLNKYEKIIICSGRNSRVVNRIMGGVADSCITFKEPFYQDDISKLKMDYFVDIFNNKFKALEIPKGISEYINTNTYLEWFGKEIGDQLITEFGVL